MKQLRILAELAKSGIISLVLISVLGGYLIGQPPERPFDLARLLLTLLGVLGLSAGASALNQLQEQKIDALMPRTARRPLPSGRLSANQALLFVAVSLVFGVAILASLSLDLLGLGFAAVISYNGLYTLWWKKKWAYAAVPGAIPGAIPILMGHAAASNQVWSPAGVFLFALLFFWQMPHFWALALHYQADYSLGGFPTLPVTHGERTTLAQIILWCLAYLGLALVAPIFLHVGWIYFVPALLTSIQVLYKLRTYYRHPLNRRWLPFFLWVNLSLIIFLATAVIDLWSSPFIMRSWLHG